MEKTTQTIKQNFPEFEIRAVKKLGEGWMSRVFLVNDEFVFRFPKHKDAGRDLEKEIKILPELAKHISVRIPCFEYVGKQENGLPFVGYKILPGKLLNEDEFLAMSVSQKETLSRQIARFIDELSGFPAEKAKHLGVPVNDFYQDYSETYREVKEKVLPLLSKETQKRVCVCFEEYLNDASNFKYRPTLIHADLSPNHYLVNPETYDLVGIIDFGDLEIGDPDYEYTYILEDCGKNFLAQVLKFRQQKSSNGVFKKVSFFVLVDHLGYILEGIKRKDNKFIDDGITAVDRWIAKFF